MIEYEDIILENEQFKNFCKGDINASSFMFISDDEVFLNNFSYCFAKFLLCLDKTSKPCKKCETCKKVSLLSFSDLVIYPKKHTSILVEDIKDLTNNIYLAPLEGDKKVFILNNFSSATVQAQNKLLKILEEPPANSFIILNVTNENKVLSTIKSRCKKLRLNRLSEKEILLATKSFDENKNVAFLSDGNLTKAINYYNDSNFGEIYNACLKTLTQMKDSRSLVKYSSMLSKKREDINLVLEIFESFFRDILLIRLNKENLVKNKNALASLKLIKDEYTSSCLDKILRKINEIREHLNFNCNVVFLIDNLLLYILEVKFLCKE